MPAVRVLLSAIKFLTCWESLLQQTKPVRTVLGQVIWLSESPLLSMFCAGGLGPAASAACQARTVYTLPMCLQPLLLPFKPLQFMPWLPMSCITTCSYPFLPQWHQLMRHLQLQGDAAAQGQLNSQQQQDQQRASRRSGRANRASSSVLPKVRA
jgi:hypothetical protein